MYIYVNKQGQTFYRTATESRIDTNIHAIIQIHRHRDKGTVIQTDIQQLENR